MQVAGIIPESGEVLTHYHHMFDKTDTSCCQIKMGTVAYLGGHRVIISLTKQTRHATCQCRYGGVPVYCADPVSGYQMLSSYFYVSQVSRQTWIKKGHQQDANLCGAYARPTNERSLVREGEGYNQGSFVYFAKAWRGWVCAGVNGVVCVDVK